MKKIIFLVFIASFMAVGCTKTNTTTEETKPSSNGITKKSAVSCVSSTGLDDNFRALIGDGSTIEMDIEKLASNTVNVSTSSVTTISSDRSSLRVYDVGLNTTTGKAIIPNDGNEYWLIYYDDSEPPLKLTGDVTYTCTCNVEGKDGCDVSIADCVVSCSLSGDCQLAQSSCCKSTTTDDGTGSLTTVRSAAVILKADAINYNGTLYN